MSSRPLDWPGRLRALWPAATPVSAREKWRAALGALLAVVLTGSITHLMLGQGHVGTWLVAPMGASAVLLFALPSSPMAQPWPVIGGSVLSALTGIAVSRWVPELHVAAGLAVGLSMALMSLARCLHPPGGALALLVVLTQTRDLGFVLNPVLLNAVLAIAGACVYNPLTGRPYPHPPAPPAPGGLAPRANPSDIDAALRERGEFVDMDRRDLQALVQEVEHRAFERTLGELKCSDIMSPMLVVARPQERLEIAWQRLREYGFKALPVVDEAGQVCGILTRADFIKRWHGDGALEPLAAKTGGLVDEWMTRPVRVVQESTHLIELLPLFSEEGHHHLPIVDAQRRLVGMLTQTDVVRALFRSLS